MAEGTGSPAARAESAAGARHGKLGLALSGGGFRASFFHIGVLARMAELGLLRQVEVLSTVSGGSIVGALYYLLLRRLLQREPHDKITDADYVELVRELERRFRMAVESNFRMSTFASVWKNLKMLSARYSRSDRIGELYDERLYRPAMECGYAERHVQLRHVKIHPPGYSEHHNPFHPRLHNHDRCAKVPILKINATCLNTGRRWVFEASTMGEPTPPELLGAIDTNMWLVRPEGYETIAAHHQDFELGLAVAASAAVPGLFHPLAISGLYEEGVRVQLVDGGVHDNQGIQALLEEGCRICVVSDGSGQLEDEEQPSTGLLASVSRTGDILMDRVRECQAQQLHVDPAVRLWFIHLRAGIPRRLVGWIDRRGNVVRRCGRSSPDPPTTEFGVAVRVQEALSRIRTDLDAFTEVEALSLEAAGYLIAERELREVPCAADAPGRGEWRFQRVIELLRRPTPAYGALLRAASWRFFKPLVFLFYLNRWLATAVAVAVVAVPAAGLLWAWPSLPGQLQELLGRTYTLGGLLAAAALVALALLPGTGWLVRRLPPVRGLRWLLEWYNRVLMRVALPVVGALFVKLHLGTVNRLYLALGRLERLR